MSDISCRRQLSAVNLLGRLVDKLTMTATLERRATDSAQAISEACILLFGDETEVSPEFVNYLQVSGLKAAYRQRAMQNHPDLALQIGVEAAELQQRFNRIRRAYELLLPYVTGEKRVPQWQIPTAEDIPSMRRQTYAPYDYPTARPHRRYQHYQPNTKRTLHRGKLPQKALRFAEFLYYNRRVSWENMFAALIWQRLNRPRLGEIALEKGWLRADDMLTVRREKKLGELLGETAIRLGLLDAQKLRWLLTAQKLYACPIGRYFTEHHLLSTDEVARLLIAQRQHNFSVEREKGKPIK